MVLPSRGEAVLVGVSDGARFPIDAVRPFSETIALLTKLGAKNNNRYVSS